MDSNWKQFFEILSKNLINVKDKNIIIYGCNRGWRLY